jgi:tetratricopeptide (TPR) repeat protein
MTGNKRTWRPVFAATIIFLIGSNSWSATVEEADGYYQREQWAEAAQAYEDISRENRSDARALYRTAVSLRHLGKLDDAHQWLTKAGKAGLPIQYIQLEQAHIKLANGNKSGAIAALDAAEIAGLADPSVLAEDQGFEPLYSDLRFKAVLERVRKNHAPCEFDKTFRQFDFWIGDWRVVDGSGAFQGTNKIEKLENGCLLVEKWSSANGSTGTSMNFYDAAAGQWVQLWVSPTIQIDIRGGLEGQSMILTGNIHYLQSEQDFVFRGTWTPQAEGVVRQHFEQSADRGGTWTTWFDGYYHPD